MHPQSHRIQALQLTLRGESSTSAEAWRGQLREWVDNEAQNCLAAVCDAWCPPDEVRQIKALNLSVRIEDLSNLAEAVQTELWRQLENAVDSSGTASRHSTMDAEPAATRQSVAASDQQMLLHYLYDGVLPWPMAMQQRERVLEQFQQLLRQQRSAILASLQSGEWSSWFAVLRRILQLTPKPEQPEVLTILLARAAHALPSAWLLIAERSEQAQRFSRFWIATWLASDVVARHFQMLTTQLALSTESLTSIPALLPLFCTLVERNDAETIEKVLGQVRGILPSADFPVLLRSAPGMARSPELEQPSPVADETSEQLRGVSMFHAGAVLLHPYLSTLFAACGICQKGDKRILPEQLPRAAQLLHYLACGEIQAQDFDTPFYALLLGVYPRAISLSDSALSPQDCAEADALLLAVLSHWTALKQTRVESLQLSFLQRRGVLVEDAQGLTLHIHKEAFDVLLTHLPWSINMVKLSWMPKPLLVVW